MADKLIFELVSPSALLASEEVDMVVVPGADGDFGVLAGHAPVLSNLRAGVVDIHNDGQVTKSLFVEGGFAEAAGEQGFAEFGHEGPAFFEGHGLPEFDGGYDPVTAMGYDPYGECRRGCGELKKVFHFFFSRKAYVKRFTLDHTLPKIPLR